MQCSATKPDGSPCAAYALKDGDKCLAHSDRETQELVGFGGPQEGAGRPRRPRLQEVYEDVAEEYREQIREVLVDALQAEQAVVVGGNSKDAHIEMVPDHRIRLAAQREVGDRVLGKPGQHSLTDLPANVTLIQALIVDPDVRELAAELRRRVAAGRTLQPGGLGPRD